MEKTIKIGSLEVPMKATANTPKQYRATFNRDLLVEMTKFYNALGKSGEVGKNADISVIENLGYIMARQADPSIGSQEEWLDNFGVFDIYNAMSEIVQLWGDSTTTTSEAKKK